MSDKNKMDSSELKEMMAFLTSNGTGIGTEMSEKAFRWSLVFQIKDCNAELAHIRELLSGVQTTVHGLEDIRIKFGNLERGIQELEKKVGSENLVDIKHSVESVKKELDDIKSQLLKCDLIKMQGEIESLKEWQRRRELKWSDEAIDKAKKTMEESNNFQIKVTAIAAAALSGLTFLSTVFKIFGGN